MLSILEIFSCTSEIMAIFGGPVVPESGATGRKDCMLPLDVSTVDNGAWRSFELIYFEDRYKIKIDYLENRRINNFKKTNNFNLSKIFIAYYLNKVRLIDNL